MTYVVDRPSGVDAFLDRAGVLLAAHEAEHNIFFGLTAAIRARGGSLTDRTPIYATVADADGRVVLAALGTPPYNLLLTLTDDHTAIDALAHGLRDELLPGVSAAVDVAERFALAWTAATGATARIWMRERIFRLRSVVAPRRPAAGRPRLARPADRERLAGWFRDFQAEALPDDPPIADALAVADRWIAGDDRWLWVWEDGGDTVAMAGATGEAPNGIRINSVYTPPPLRNRGYATSLVAAVSQAQLDRGRRFCFLFTDLANPTSNAIYRAIGYEPVCDIDLYRFESTPTEGGR